MIAEDGNRGVHGAGKRDVRSFLFGAFAFEGRYVGAIDDMCVFGVCRG